MNCLGGLSPRGRGPLRLPVQVLGLIFDLLNLSVTSQGHASVSPTMNYEEWTDIYVGENLNLGGFGCRPRCILDLGKTSQNEEVAIFRIFSEGQFNSVNVLSSVWGGTWIIHFCMWDQANVSLYRLKSQGKAMVIVIQQTDFGSNNACVFRVQSQSFGVQQ